mmetsp:Transcript_18780/g.26437  ORF Transcript_18780/g.26437 Transcript_18780/m.26437 type:complete len:331 (-) Transcript_18780:239-1231(-)
MIRGTYERMRVTELRNVLRSKLLETTGKKAELIDRILEHAGRLGRNIGVTTKANFGKMRATELRELLDSKKLDTKGKKADLVDRLMEHSQNLRKRKECTDPPQKLASKKARKCTGSSEMATEPVIVDKTLREALLDPKKANACIAIPLKKYLPVLTVTKLVLEYAPSALVRLHKSMLALRHPLDKPRCTTPEACLFLLLLKEATHYRPKKKKKRKKGNSGGSNAKPPKARGWGFKTLYGGLKGSRAEAVRKSGIVATLGWGRHLPEKFWKKMCTLLERKNFIAPRLCRFMYGSGVSYTLSEQGERLIAEVVAGIGGGVEIVTNIIQEDLV